MGKRCTILRAAWLVAAVLFPRPVQAQPASDDSIEIFGGYSYLRDPGNAVLSETASDDVYALGWFAGAAYRIWRRVDLVGEIGGQYKSGVTLDEDATFSLHAFLGGARASVRMGPTTLFSQILTGVTHGRATAFDTSVSFTALTLQPGAGVDYSLGAHWATRVQFDYRLLPPHEGIDLTSQFRLAVGMVHR